MDKLIIDDPEPIGRPRSTRNGYQEPPPGLTGADLAAWIESQHKQRQNDSTAVLNAKKAEVLKKAPAVRPAPPARPQKSPVTPPVTRGLSSVAPGATTPPEPKPVPVTATMAPGDLETTSTLAPPALNTRVLQECYKESYKDEYKSDTRVPGSPAASGAVGLDRRLQNPGRAQREPEPEIDFAAWMQLSAELASFEKSAKTKPIFRLCFDLGRLLKFARRHNLDDAKVRATAAAQMLPWEEVEQVAEKVRQNLNEDAFQAALAAGVVGVPGLDGLDPALRPVAALAFQLQAIAGATATIYLVQTKIAQAFKVSQPAISRVLYHLKKIRWLEEVGREKRGRKDYVRYRCPSAIAQNVPVIVVEKPEAIEGKAEVHL